MTETVLNRFHIGSLESDGLGYAPTSPTSHGSSTERTNSADDLTPMDDMRDIDELLHDDEVFLLVFGDASLEAFRLASQDGESDVQSQISEDEMQSAVRAVGFLRRSLTVGSKLSSWHIADASEVAQDPFSFSMLEDAPDPLSFSMGMFEVGRSPRHGDPKFSSDDFQSLISTAASSSEDQKDEGVFHMEEDCHAEADSSPYSRFQPKFGSQVKLVHTAAKHDPMTRADLKKYFHHRGIIKNVNVDDGSYDVEFRGQMLTGLRTPEHFRVRF